MKEQPDRDQDLPCQGLAAAPGRQRTPASRAWSWPRCGPATGVLGALRAMGRLLKETRTLQAVGEAHVSLFTHALPADNLCEDPRPTGETVLARESPISPKWALTGVVEGSACLVQLSPLATHSRETACLLDRKSFQGRLCWVLALKELLVQRSYQTIINHIDVVLREENVSCGIPCCCSSTKQCLAQDRHSDTGLQ